MRNWALIVTPKAPSNGITKTWSQSLILINSSFTKAPVTSIKKFIFIILKGII